MIDTVTIYPGFPLGMGWWLLALVAGITGVIKTSKGGWWFWDGLLALSLTIMAFGGELAGPSIINLAVGGFALAVWAETFRAFDFWWRKPAPVEAYHVELTVNATELDAALLKIGEVVAAQPRLRPTAQS